MAKAGIHPNYQLATITCACGAVYESASTRGSFSVEICASCHPFYTVPKAEKKPEAPKAEKKPEAPKVEKKPEAPKADKKPKA